MIDEADQLLTTADVCRLLKIDRWTVERMRDRGDLPFVRIGQRLVRFRLADVRKLIDDGKVAS